MNWDRMKSECGSGKKRRWEGGKVRRSEGRRGGMGQRAWRTACGLEGGKLGRKAEEKCGFGEKEEGEKVARKWAGREG